MANMLGNDPEQMDRLCRKMEEEAGKIEGALRLVTQQLQQTEWRGPDRTRFEGEWNGQHSANLRKAAELLKANATTIKREAAEQRRVSGA